MVLESNNRFGRTEVGEGNGEGDCAWNNPKRRMSQQERLEDLGLNKCSLNATNLYGLQCRGEVQLYLHFANGGGGSKDTDILN